MIARRQLLGGLGAALALAPLAVARAYVRGEVEFRRAYCDTRLGQVHVLVARPRGVRRPARPPLALFHPTAASGDYFELYMQQMATDRIVVAPDTPGFGRSDRLAAPPAGLDVYAGALADALVTLARDWRVRQLDVCGFHTGAFLAAEIALQQPRLVRRVLLSAIPYYEAGEPREAMLRRLTAERGLPQDFEALAGSWRGAVTDRNPGMSYERAFHGWLTQLSAEPDHWYVFQSLFGWPAERRLPAITQPVGVLAVHNSLLPNTRAAVPLLGNAKLIDLPELTTGAWDVGAGRLARESRALLDDWDGRPQEEER